MNFLGANKVWQVIVLVVLLAGLAVGDYLYITSVEKPVQVPLGGENFFAQMNYRRIYVDQYGEETIYNRIVAEKARLQAAFEEDLAAAQARVATGEKDVALPTGPAPVSEEWIRSEASLLGKGEVIATVELNMVEAIILCAALTILVLYLFNVLFLSRGRSVVESAPDHSD
ncbi:MAG: hypothetical protein A2Y64_03850 [Candidatus Coatesbacteria bacterium RBG_13_66_14]|uniref:Uncharacterized protein n=1 Tax=Candidatus Coatesbacteria bacterium RBG_13_66_14 TaxID=1817816 RepID=A0A1F5F766_9BACT|nr:MAG: hypothetical protein A2Y64_03850 [Candidatus Coatesbacteria bacterium RBG_13_66_14]